MKRRLFTILSALSLLLLVAVAVMWVRSYFGADLFEYVTHAKRPVGRGHAHFHNSRVEGGCARGRFYLTYERFSFLGDDRPLSSWYSEGPLLSFHQTVPQWAQPMWGTKYLWNQMGFRLGTAEESYVSHTRRLVDVSVPYWVLAAVAAWLPAMWAWAAVRRSRVTRVGVCPSCGYDLRATLDRCPECGRPAAAMN